MGSGRSIAALLLTALLAACAVGGPLPIPDGPVPEGAVPAPDRAPLALTAADGSALAVSVWEAPAPKAILLALHGYGDYGESTFADAGTFWAGEGITTIAYDQRGFGRNPSRGLWPGADGLVADLKRVVVDVRAAYPGKPIFVLGHSMGGGVVLAAAPELEVDGIILAAPAIWGGGELNPIHRAASWLAAATVPEKRFTGEGVVRIQPSDNIEALRKLGRDPLYLRPPSAREIFGLVRVIDLAVAVAGEVTLPSLLLIGERDELIPKRTVTRVFERVQGARTVRRYPDGWHLLFRDLQARVVWEDVADWIDDGR